MKLEKATLKVKPGTEGGLSRTELECGLNPKEISYVVGADWKSQPTRGAKKAPKQEYIGKKPGQLKLELVFYEWESQSGDVSADVETLMEWTGPTPASLSKNKPSPPVIVFHWGKKFSFDATVRQVDARYTQFRRDGTPVLAIVKTTLEEIPMEGKKQNPTSGGPPGRRSCVVGAGDTLPLIAFAEYGTPAYWRGLAAANGIDDPLSIEPGMVLLVPSSTDVAEIS